MLCALNIYRKYLVNMERYDFIDLIDRTESSAYFDETIGHIQEIILCPEFQQLQMEFCEQHWQTFDFDEENKIEYTGIYESYQMIFENYLANELRQRMRHFTMQQFDDELNKQRHSHKLIDDEIIELIDTISDFQKFKESMLDYRAMKEGQLQYIESGNILMTRSIG